MMKYMLKYMMDYMMNILLINMMNILLINMMNILLINMMNPTDGSKNCSWHLAQLVVDPKSAQPDELILVAPLGFNFTAILGGLCWQRLWKILLTTNDHGPVIFKLRMLKIDA